MLQLVWALLLGVMIGVIFILAGIIIFIDLSMRIFLIIIGVLMLIGVGIGFKNLKKIKWG